MGFVYAFPKNAAETATLFRGKITPVVLSLFSKFGVDRATLCLEVCSLKAILYGHSLRTLEKNYELIGLFS
jgi:hypothetical protein